MGSQNKRNLKIQDWCLRENNTNRKEDLKVEVYYLRMKKMLLIMLQIRGTMEYPGSNIQQADEQCRPGIWDIKAKDTGVIPRRGG